MISSVYRAFLFVAFSVCAAGSVALGADGKPEGKAIAGELGAAFPALSPDGKQLAFSMHGDIWIAPAEGGYARSLTLSEAYDTKPRWSPDGKLIAFSSTRSGNYDIWVTPADAFAPRRLTYDYAFDSISDWSPDGKSIYFHSNRDGEMNIWTVPSGGGLARQITFTGGRDLAVSPDGTMMVFSNGLSDPEQKMYRGSGNWDLYRISKPGDVPEPITSFDGNDRTPFFSRDGSALFYVSEKSGIFNIYLRNLATGEERAVTESKSGEVMMPCLSFDGRSVVYVNEDAVWRTEIDGGATVQIPLIINPDVKEPIYAIRTVTAGAEQASWSPDGRSVAFSLRGDIWVMPASGGMARQLTSGPDQDQWPVFSPDGRYVAFFSDRSGNKDIWIIPSGGGALSQLTDDKADDFFHSWSPDGRYLAFCSTRSGNKDIWLLDLNTRKTAQLTNDPQADDDPCFSPDGRWIAFDSGRSGTQNIYVMPSGGGQARRLTSGSFDQIPTWSPDGRFIAFEAQVAQGVPSGIWMIAADGSSAVQVDPHGSSPRWCPRGRTIMFERETGNTRQFFTVEAPEEIRPGVQVNFVAITEVDVLKERQQAFEEAWRLIKETFYDPKMHGVDWDGVRKRYEARAAHLRTDEDLVMLINRMLGELRASHMGFWGNVRQVRNPDPPTGYLGMRLDKPEGDDKPGLAVMEVVPGGPADQAWIRPGDRVFAIGGKPLGSSSNLDELLAGSVGKQLQLRVGPTPDHDRARTVVIVPVTWGAVRELQYRQWLGDRSSIVSKAGGGRIGYVHLRMMGDQDLEQFKQAVAGPLAKTEALILDVRNNGGGHIHADLMDILTRRPFGAYHPRGGKRTEQPHLYYMKPVVVLINENSFSDAEVFPFAFKELKRGKVIGVPTAGGVIGTGSATLINGFTLRLPRVGWFGLQGVNLEGLGVKPDILVPETPEDRMKNRDPQLSRAIEELLKEIAPPAKKEPVPAGQEGGPGKSETRGEEY